MVNLILGILLCSIALTALTLFHYSVSADIRKDYFVLTAKKAFWLFVIYLVLLSSLFFIGDLLLNVQVTL